MPGSGSLRVGHGVRIERPRLLVRASAALDSGALLLTAGAGFGKTTLIEQALDGLGREAVWLACREADRDPGQLLLRLLRALSGAVPGAVDPLAERLQRAPGPIDVEAAVGELTTDLERTLVEPVYVVFDDAERLAPAPEALAVLARLVRSEALPLRLVIASRRRLDLRLAKPRATGRVTELSDSDLAFTHEEVAELAARLRQGALAPEEEVAIVTAAQGWPLAVALLARHGPSAGAPIPPPDRLPDLVRAFLEEEVLDRLEPHLREALLTASVAAELSPAVMRALDLPADLGAGIARAGIPIRTSAEQDATIAYHPLVRELFEERLLAERGAESWRELHARIAPALAAGGSVVEAIEHSLTAEAWTEAAALIERAGPDLVRSSPALVSGWLERLPAAAQADPGIALLAGWLRWGAGDNPAAAGLLAGAAEGFHGREDSAREWMARLMLIDALVAQGELDTALEAVPGLTGPAVAEAGLFAPAAAEYLAMSLATYGRFEESERFAAIARAHPSAGTTASLNAVHAGVLAGARGELAAAADALHAALADRELPDPLNLRLYTWEVLTKVLDAAGEREEAIATWDQAERELAGGLAPNAARHHALAKLHAQLGRVAEAEAELAQAGSDERGWRAHTRPLAEAWIGAVRGDSGAVAAAAAEVRRLRAAGPPLIVYESARDLAPALAMSGDRQGALAELEAALERIDLSFPVERGSFLRASLLALRAWLHEEDADPAAADPDLEAMWSEAGDARRYILRREWPRLEPVFWAAAERGAIGAERAVEAARHADPAGAAVTALLDHQRREVRLAALDPALASGQARAVRRLPELAEDEDASLAEAATAALRDLAARVPPLRFRVLGEFAVERGGWRLEDADWGRPSAARLVRYLLVNRPAPVPADLIAEDLWRDLAPDRARDSLQVAVSRARRALDLPGAGESVVAAVDGGYRLALGDRVRVDAEEFAEAAEAALAASAGEREALLERARSLWSGQPLPSDRYEQWTISWRERLVDRYLAVLTELVELRIATAEYPAAVAAAQDALKLDRLNEGAHRALMLSHARTGRTGRALQGFLECRRTMVRELGVEPSAETVALHQRILAGQQV